MSLWNKYYKRPAFLEGFLSVFDLFGVNSSYRSDVHRMTEREYIANSMRRSFADVGGYLSIAMEDFSKNNEETE